MQVEYCTIDVVGLNPSISHQGWFEGHEEGIIDVRDDKSVSTDSLVNLAVNLAVNL